ncbi:MAG: hypothetical protein CMJ64_12560 [Planctomycetaceae bacterium]|nr:hypothetical protein [Planctomycetaceae bacterium]
MIQALRHLGKERVDDDVIRRLRQRLSIAHRKSLLKDVRYSADWIFEIIKKIAHHADDADG